MSSEETLAPGWRVPHESRQLLTQLHERALRAVMLSLPSGEPSTYLYDLLPRYPLRSGKGLRPILCMAACAAFGGSYDEALPFAAALELLHNAFLVHDDIQDGSPYRRGRPALHVQHGTPLALNVGDALAASANAAIVRAAQPLRPPLAAALLEGWERMIRETIEGQALDLGWQRDNVVDMSIPDYVVMCGKKTAWYTVIQPLAIGVIVGSGRSARERETFRFGWFLGLLFQIANDLDGVRATAGESDIEEGKRTILLIHLMGALNGPDREEVVRIMGLPRHERGPEEVAWVLAQMEQAGSFDYARSCLLDLAAAAMREADDAFGSLPPGGARDLLLSITGYVLEQSGLGNGRRRKKEDSDNPY
jgi:geranylgeranyl diphosphate synthase type II